MISQCSNKVKGKVCGGRYLAVRYTEVAMAHFSEDGEGREDGHDVDACDLDFSIVYCRVCHKKRTITEADERLLNGMDDGDVGKDEEGQ